MASRQERVAGVCVCMRMCGVYLCVCVSGCVRCCRVYATLEGVFRQEGSRPAYIKSMDENLGKGGNQRNLRVMVIDSLTHLVDYSEFRIERGSWSLDIFSI